VSHRDSAPSLEPHAAMEPRGRPLSRSKSASPTRSQALHLAPLTPPRDDEPVVMHAHEGPGGDWTLGTYVGFRDVCAAIRESAFKDNSLPVIVSLEVHADPEQQEVMVRIMREEWPEYLLDRPYQGCDPRLRLPALEDLHNKILIKVKKAVSRTLVNNSMPGQLGVNLARFESDAAGGGDAAGPAPKKVRICEALSSLAVYTHSEHFGGLDERAAKTPSHIFSLDEKAIDGLHEAQPAELFAHNRRYFMRAYPSAYHVDSSNMDPSTCWRRGVQMAALNWQRLDEAMMLNAAMFAGQDGWVLKPAGYRSTDAAAARAAEAGARRTLDLRLTVLAGQHVPLPGLRQRASPAAAAAGVAARAHAGFRPFVKVELHVEKRAERGDGPSPAGRAAEDQLKQRTPARETDSPDWGARGAAVEFKAVPKVVEELSFVR